MRFVNRLFGAVMLMTLLTAFVGYTSAAVESGAWTLSGVVYDAGTCQMLAGAHVFSPTYSTASNLSTVNGNYLVRLGRGSQTIDVSLAGYSNFTYTTPYEPIDTVITYNIGMLKSGETAVTCSFSAQNTPGTSNYSTSTVPPVANTTIATTVVTTSAPVTVKPTTSISGGTALAIAAIVIIIIIILVVAYYFASGKRAKK